MLTELVNVFDFIDMRLQVKALFPKIISCSYPHMNRVKKPGRIGNREHAHICIVSCPFLFRSRVITRVGARIPSRSTEKLGRVSCYPSGWS
jgi:hypothetical protein